MQVKIKNNIDLNELTKFGYEKEYEDGESYYCKYLSDNEHKLFIYDDRIIKQGKFVLIFGFSQVDLDTNNILDLIKADLVDYIEEE